MATKVCFKCGIEKDLDEFYKHPKMADGHVNKCKTCNKKDVHDNYDKISQDAEWVDYERERGRNKYHRLNYKETQKPTTDERRKKQLRYCQKYPEKKKGQTASQHMNIPEGYEKHHWSYKEQHYKDVFFLTIADHNTAHRFMIYDQERFMYRTLDGVLLDTKDEHEKYINKYIKN